MPDWYYEQGGNRQGPVSSEQIKMLLSENKLGDSTLVWTPSFGQEWKSVSSAGLAHDDGPPPLPARQVSATFAWAIALVPIIGAGLERLTQDAAPKVLSTHTILLGYLCTYVVLCYLDGRAIKRSGRARDVALLGWIWFVPIYLIQRSRALGTQRYLLPIWITAVVASIWITSPEILSKETYWGFGLPQCEAPSAKENVISILNERIPALKSENITALSMQNIKQVGDAEKRRSCSAVVLMSNAELFDVSFNISEHDDHLWYEAVVNGRHSGPVADTPQTTQEPVTPDVGSQNSTAEKPASSENSTSRDTAMRGWQNAVRSKILREVLRSDNSKAGQVRIKFTEMADGTIGWLEHDGDGDPALADSAMAAVKRAVPLPLPPDGRAHTLTVPITFHG